MVLDCGCGGGANIKTLLKLCPSGKVQGIDYSAVSVEKARKVNAGAIAAGRCTVQQASVAELPFEAEQFAVVTAFETVYFWPELAQNFKEVYRVLKPGGTFFICNEANGETAKDDKISGIRYGVMPASITARSTGIFPKARKRVRHAPPREQPYAAFKRVMPCACSQSVTSSTVVSTEIKSSPVSP